MKLGRFYTLSYSPFRATVVAMVLDNKVDHQSYDSQLGATSMEVSSHGWLPKSAFFN
jgi:hypothetical protein